MALFGKKQHQFLAHFFRDRLGLEPFCERPRKVQAETIITLAKDLAIELKQDNSQFDIDSFLKELE
jgi:hypothetical protein